MKIAIIGSTAYKERMLAYKKLLESIYKDIKVSIPAFDDHPELNELGICKYNLWKIKEADRVDIFWDCRSMGTIFDFGMAFALGKPIKVVYLEPKTFMNVMRQYEADNSCEIELKKKV